MSATLPRTLARDIVHIALDFLLLLYSLCTVSCSSVGIGVLLLSSSRYMDRHHLVRRWGKKRAASLEKLGLLSGLVGHGPTTLAKGTGSRLRVMCVLFSLGWQLEASVVIGQRSVKGRIVQRAQEACRGRQRRGLRASDGQKDGHGGELGSYLCFNLVRFA